MINLFSHFAFFIFIFRKKKKKQVEVILQFPKLKMLHQSAHSVAKVKLSWNRMWPYFLCPRLVIRQHQRSKRKPGIRVSECCSKQWIIKGKQADGAHQGEAIDKSQVCFKAEDVMSFRIVKKLLLKELMETVASKYAAHEWSSKLRLGKPVGSGWASKTNLKNNYINIFHNY